jgi:hypothetical protein
VRRGVLWGALEGNLMGVLTGWPGNRRPSDVATAHAPPTTASVAGADRLESGWTIKV